MPFHALHSLQNRKKYKSKIHEINLVRAKENTLIHVINFSHQR